MNILTRTTLVAAVLVATSPISHSADVRFNGTVEPVCSVVVGSDGVMKSSADGRKFGSKELGGVAGTVVVTSNTNQLSFSAAAPSSFTSSPTGGSEGVDFQAEFTAAGLGSSVVGTAPLPIGITTVAVDLTASKSSGTFPAGDYVADVVVTCE